MSNDTNNPSVAVLGLGAMGQWRHGCLRLATRSWSGTARHTLQAFEQAGADVLFPPGLPDLAAVRSVCTALSKPVNFMVGIKGKSFWSLNSQRPV